MKKANEDISDNGEHKIDIETECNDLPNEVQDEDENELKKPDEQKDEDLQKIKVENNTNPLFYEIGPFPRKPRTVWIQYIGPPQGQGSSFDYSPSRNDFVRFVFALVLVMLICTAGICYFCHVTVPVRSMFENKNTSTFFLMLASLVSMAMSYAFTCSGCTRVAPCSFICLGIVVMAFSVFCAYFSIKYNTYTVFLAIVATSAVIIVCLGLACTSFDFTSCLLIVIVAMVAFFAAILCGYLFMLVTQTYIKPLHMAFLAIGTVLHSVILVIQFQMILGGRSVELSEDDYAYGAFTVYTSIVSIFLNLMQLLNMEDL